MATQAQTRKKTSSAKKGVFVHEIQGRYRQITIHQLALAWWLFAAKHITKRQLRVYFAAHEMAEKRRYTKTTDPDSGRPRKPEYKIDEIQRLVGGRGSKAAKADLSRDVKALARLGLVIISKEAIEFAVSIDQIHIEDVTGFWEFFEKLPNTGRRLPMPRRTCRALAAGFQKSTMAMMIALMIRSLYWHKGEQGGYRIDGRTKCSWISEVFGVSRRSVTDARTRLIELGWITPIDAPQWELNKWGQRYRINVDWKPADTNAAAVDGSAGNTVDDAVGEGGEDPSGVGEIASPSRDYRTKSASPCLNTSTPSSKEDLKTKKPAPITGAGTAMGFGSRKRRLKKTTDHGPDLRHIQPEHLRSTADLLVLHEQAVERGWAKASEAGRLDFLALAERARAHGTNPAGLFTWLIKNDKREFITQADEDDAASRLREYRQPKPERHRSNQEDEDRRKALKKRQFASFMDSLSDDERFVHACIVAARQHRIEPFRAAQMGKGWSREQWDTAQASYEIARQRRWFADELTFTPGFSQFMDSDLFDVEQGGDE